MRRPRLGRHSIESPERPAAGMVAEAAGPQARVAIEAGAKAWRVALDAAFVAQGNWTHPKARNAALTDMVDSLPDLLGAGSAVVLPMLLPAFYGLGLLALVVVAREIGERPANSAANVREDGKRPGFAAVQAYGKRYALLTQGAVAKAISEQPSTLSAFVNGSANEEQQRRIAAALEVEK